MLLLLSILVLAGCGVADETGEKKEEKTESSQKTALNWPVEDFRYTDHEGNKFGLSDLKGKIWIADFIFTNCNTICPPMTANMEKVQSELKESGLDVQFVSFSIDPERDTPEVLTKFAKQHHANLSNWHFLTGYPFDDIQDLAESSFRMKIQKDPDSDQVIHGSSFYLIDSSGKVVYQYNGMKPDVQEIIQDVQSLQKEG
ncbi:SCO family protein [Melghirimyces algeriensis]